MNLRSRASWKPPGFSFRSFGRNVWGSPQCLVNRFKIFKSRSTIYESTL